MNAIAITCFVTTSFILFHVSVIWRDNRLRIQFHYKYVYQAHARCMNFTPIEFFLSLFTSINRPCKVSQWLNCEKITESKALNGWEHWLVYLFKSGFCRRNRWRLRIDIKLQNVPIVMLIKTFKYILIYSQRKECEWRLGTR